MAQAKDAIHPREGACGICHAVAEEICRTGGRIAAYEQADGILARIFDHRGLSWARNSAWSGRRQFWLQKSTPV